ncbi:MAG TPA: hypothetical protein VF812_10015 [Ktedonobacterales bacterium]
MALTLHHKGDRLRARRYGLSEASLRHYQRDHRKLSLQANMELGSMLSSDHPLEKLSDLDAATLEMLTEARQVGDLRAALAAIRESRGNIESYSRIGVLDEVEERLAALEAQARATLPVGTSSDAGADDQ